MPFLGILDQKCVKVIHKSRNEQIYLALFIPYLYNHGNLLLSSSPSILFTENKLRPKISIFLIHCSNKLEDILEKKGVPFTITIPINYKVRSLTGNMQNLYEENALSRRI